MSSYHLLTITAPTKWLGTNQRDHFHTRSVAVASWRAAAAWSATAQRLPKLGMGPVHITATIHRENKRRFDLDGAAPTIKAAIDGIRDAGCLDEDDWRVIPKLTIQYGEPWSDAALVLRIEPLGDES